MEKILITDRNRDGAQIWFESVDNMPGYYTINTDEKHKYILEYACINYDKVDNDAQDYDAEFTNSDGTITKGFIHSFDPSGGPYMSIGCKFENGYKLNRIYMLKGEPTYFNLIKE